jgi:hypothetical protein
MSYVLNRYNGSQLLVLDDGALDNSTSINLIGRNYTGYGSIQNENFLYLLENFANTAAPLRPLSGQLWYNSTTKTLKLYDGAEWKSASSANLGVTPPTAGEGDFWFNTTINQLNVYSGGAWKVIGPEGVAGYGDTKIVGIELTDTNVLKHPALLVKVDGTVEAVFSATRYEIASSNAIVGFSTLERGINVPANSFFGGNLRGNADTATALKNSPKINGFIFTGENDVTIKSPTIGALNKGAYIIGSNFDGSIERTWSIDAGPESRAGKIVARDATGSFAAVGITATTITADTFNGKIVSPTGVTSEFDTLTANTIIGGFLAGNADTANTLKTARTINGVPFNGSADITITAAAETLTGTQIKSTVIDSALQSVGTLNSLEVKDSGISIGNTNNLNLFVDSNKSKIVSNKNLQITILDTAGIGGQSTLEFQPGSAPLLGDAPTPTLLPSGTWNIGASSRRFNQIYTVISNATTLKVDSIAPSTPAATSVTVATDLIVSGNFTVNGTTTTINSTQTTINDLVVTLAKGAANPTAANGAGIEIDGAGATLTYTVAGNKWNVNKDLDAGTNNFITSGAFQGTATSARYADLAENYVSDAQYEPGEVLEFGGDFEVTIARDATVKVAGVVSTNPAHLMNSDCEGQYVVAVALQGRVPVKVRGEIRKGDMLIAAGGGFARRTTNPQLGTIIGKALEDFDGIEGVIEVVVGRI